MNIKGTKYRIGADTEIIPAHALCGRCDLTYAVIPSSVKVIGQYAFFGCRKLGTVDLTAFSDPEDIPVLTDIDAFSETADCLRFKAADRRMIEAFSKATNWAAFAERFTAEGKI